MVLQELQQRTDKAGLARLYPAEGSLRRELYPKHLKMFAAGREHNERLTLGGNRVGKSFGIGAYETALHLTGLYPDWWEGRVFNKPIQAWACGTKSTKVRNVNQKFILGKLKQLRGRNIATGGFIPSRRCGRITRKTGVSDAVDQAIIMHAKGWENSVEFKGYEEGRTSFEAEEIDWIWFDEEPPKNIYDEGKMRILTARGAILTTLTPVEGMTETVMSLLEDSELL